MDFGVISPRRMDKATTGESTVIEKAKERTVGHSTVRDLAEEDQQRRLEKSASKAGQNEIAKRWIASFLRCRTWLQ